MSGHSRWPIAQFAYTTVRGCHLIRLALSATGQLRVRDSTRTMLAPSRSTATVSDAAELCAMERHNATAATQPCRSKHHREHGEHEGATMLMQCHA